MNNIFKRTLSLLLVLVMCMSMLPASALAEGEESTETTSEQEVVEQIQKETGEDEQVSDEAEKPAGEITEEPAYIPVESISITTEKAELTVGETMRLVATVLPDDATNKEVNWTSSDETILTVDSYGLVKATSSGIATITASDTTGSVTSTLNISILENSINEILVTMNAPNTTTSYSGTCGKNLKWSLNSEGQLTIYGSGDMYDYSSSNSDTPWKSCISMIKSIIILDGVTSIGDFAFNNCSNLNSIEIPKSVTKLGSGSFKSCNLLKTAGPIGSGCNIEYGFENTIPDSAFSCSSINSIEIPNGITEIGRQAFSCCINLTNIEIPNSVTNIGNYAFDSCVSLSNVIIPSSVTSIGDCAFKDCNLLKTAGEIGSGCNIEFGFNIIPEHAFYLCDDRHVKRCSLLKHLLDIVP